MKKIAQGLPLKKYKGNKHKDGGIMVNALGNKTKDVNKAVAEVEGGEYNYRYNPNNPKDNYILSEQLGIASMAKQADRFKGNNRIDYNTRTNLLNKSMKLNEMLRVQQEQQPMQMAAFGGKLKKYEDGGDFNKTRTPKSFRHIGEFSDSLSEEQMKSIKGDAEKFNKDMMNWGKKSTTPVITPTTIPVTNPVVKSNTNPSEIKLGTNTNPKLLNLTTLPTTTPKTTAEAANTGLKLDEKSMIPNVNDLTKLTKDPTVKLGKDLTVNKKGVKDVTSGLSGIASAFGPIGQAVGMGIQLAPYAIDLGKAMFDKTSVQDLQTQGSAMRLPNTTYAKNGGKLNVVPLPRFDPGGKTPRMQKIGDYSFDSNLLYPASKEFQSQANPQGDYTNNKVFITPDNKMVIRNQNNGTYTFFNQPSSPIQKKSNIGTTTTGKNVQSALSASDIRIREAFKKGTNTLPLPLPEIIKSNKIGITNFATLDVKKEMDIAKRAGFNPLDIIEPPKQKDKLSEMLKSGLMLKGSAIAGSLFSALQGAQKETLRLPDFGRADDAMSRATAFSMNPALNEVEQARGKSQEAIRNMATTAGQLTSNLQSVNQRAGQQSAGLRVQEQQIMNQLAGQKAGYETQKASAIQQELARFDENTLMNKAATQDARVAFVENINNLGTEIMKQGNEQDIADQQDKLAVQNAKLKIIQSAFENPDIISGANLEKMLKMIEKGDYTNIPKLFGQPSNTRRVLKANDASKK
jgi:hypothetical protein